MYWWWLTLYPNSVDLFFFKWDKNSIRKLKSLLLSLLFSWLLKWKSSSLHSADATFVLLTCNLSVTMLIVLSLCESKPSHWPAQCHVGTQWCIYSVQIHGRALTCFIVHYLDLHQLCVGAEAEQGWPAETEPLFISLTSVYLQHMCWCHSLGCICDQCNRFAPVCASHEWLCARVSDRFTLKYLHTCWMRFHYWCTVHMSAVGLMYMGWCWSSQAHKVCYI